MSTTPPPPEPDEWDGHGVQHIDVTEGELLLGGYDWLRLACHVLSTLSLMLIAITLIARL